MKKKKKKKKHILKLYISNNDLTMSYGGQSIPFRPAIDGEGNYGYLKADDSFTPFKSGVTTIVSTTYENSSYYEGGKNALAYNEKIGANTVISIDDGYDLENKKLKLAYSIFEQHRTNGYNNFGLLEIQYTYIDGTQEIVGSINNQNILRKIFVYDLPIPTKNIKAIKLTVKSSYDGTWTGYNATCAPLSPTIIY